MKNLFKIYNAANGIVAVEARQDNRSFWQKLTTPKNLLATKAIKKIFDYKNYSLGFNIHVEQRNNYLVVRLGLDKHEGNAYLLHYKNSKLHVVDFGKFLTAVQCSNIRHIEIHGKYVLAEIIPCKEEYQNLFEVHDGELFENDLPADKYLSKSASSKHYYLSDNKPYVNLSYHRTHDNSTVRQLWGSDAKKPLLQLKNIDNTSITVLDGNVVRLGHYYPEEYYHITSNNTLTKLYSVEPYKELKEHTQKGFTYLLLHTETSIKLVTIGLNKVTTEDLVEIYSKDGKILKSAYLERLSNNEGYLNVCYVNANGEWRFAYHWLCQRRGLNFSNYTFSRDILRHISFRTEPSYDCLRYIGNNQYLWKINKWLFICKQGSDSTWNMISGDQIVGFRLDDVKRIYRFQDILILHYRNWKNGNKEELLFFECRETSSNNFELLDKCPKTPITVEQLNQISVGVVNDYSILLLNNKPIF